MSLLTRRLSCCSTQCAGRAKRVCGAQSKATHTSGRSSSGGRNGRARAPGRSCLRVAVRRGGACAMVYGPLHIPPSFALVDTCPQLACQSYGVRVMRWVWCTRSTTSSLRTRREAIDGLQGCGKGLEYLCFARATNTVAREQKRGGGSQRGVRLARTRPAHCLRGL